MTTSVPSSRQGALPQDKALWLGLLAFRLALDLAYRYFLVPVFKFDSPISFHLQVEVDRYLVSWLVFALFVSVIRSRSETVTNVFMFVAAVFVVAPLSSEYGMNAARPLAPVLCAAMAFLVVDLVSRVRLPEVIASRPLAGGRKLAVALAVLGVLYLVAWGIVSGSVRYLSFDLTRIYEYRDKVAELLDVGPLAYLNLWTYKVFTIFLVCVTLQHRRYGWLLIVLACQAFFFGLTSHRIVLFLPLLAIAVWWYLGRVNRLAPLPYAMALACLAALAVYRVWGAETLPEVLIRRAFYVSSGLTFQWFDFFDTHAHVLWADRLLAFLSGGEYLRVNIPRLVGEFLVPGSNSAANTGMIGAGYAQAGYAGVLLYAIILGLVMALLNAIVRAGVPLWLVAALGVGPLRTAIADSDLFTSLLSHGLGMMVLLLWLYGAPKPLQERRE